MRAVRMRVVSFGLRTHPPAPSQKEGGTLFVMGVIGEAKCRKHEFQEKGLIGEAKCRKKDFQEKDLPFLLGRGRGMGCALHTYPLPAHNSR